MSLYGHRRGSVFWALTLIAIGLIFLWQNFNPAVRPWVIIAKFWPILIIFWGLSKLIDYVQAQSHPDIVPRSLFSGSEVVLLVLILLLGTMISHLFLHWHNLPAAIGINVDNEEFGNLFTNPYTYSQSVKQTVAARPRLLILNRRGDVELRVSDQEDRADVAMVVKQTIRAESEEAAKKISDQIKVSFAEEAERYVLRTNLDSLPGGGSNVRLDLALRVPKATSAEITAERGDVVLDGLKGDQFVSGQRGDFHAANLEGMLRVRKSGGLTDIHDVKGNVELEGRGRDVEIASVSGTVVVNGDFGNSVLFRNIAQTLRYTSSRTDLTVQKLTGSINMERGSLEASGVEGPFELSTGQKDIAVTDFHHALKISNTNGDIRLRTSVPPTHPIDVDLRKGEINLVLPAASNFQIDARSNHGDVDCEFSGPDIHVRREHNGPYIAGSYGSGGPAIHLSTGYGTIRLNREGGRTAAGPSADEGEKTTRLRPLPRALRHHLRPSKII